jgi:hypothetical protein
MAIKSILERKRNNLKKLNKYQLPNYFKKIGVGLFILALISLFINALSINNFEIRAIIKYGMLIGLLFISISKEKIEDELVTKLRMQSYTFAFIFGVIFTLLLPFIDYFFDYIFKTNEAMIKDMGDWQILWILLSIQVFYFEYLKRLHR